MAFDSSVADIKNNKEASILFWEYVSFFLFLFFFVVFGLMARINFVPLFLAFTIGIVISILGYKNFLKESSDRYRELCEIIFFVILPMGILGSLALGYVVNNYFFAMGFGVPMIFSSLIMYLRRDTFSDRSIPEEGEFGYHPMAYFILCNAFGLNLVAVGFAGIHFYLINGIPNLNYCLTAIILGLIDQTIILLPDKINDIVPIDIRTKNGFKFIFILSIFLFIITSIILSKIDPNVPFRII